METPVEVRYAGVVVARATEVRHMTVGGVDLFLAMPEPLPAGTLVSLGADQQARIEKVIESADPSVAGVYVKLLAEGEAAQPWSPAFREAEVPPPPRPAVVVSPVIVRPTHAPRVEAPVPPQPPQVEPARAEPASASPREETPVVVATVAPEPSKPFVTSMPQPGEQIAHFDTPEPPPAVVERAVKKDRSKRSTIVVAIPPPAEPLDDDFEHAGTVEAVGEIDTGSRQVRKAQPSVQSASIVVEADPHYDEASEQAAEPAREEPKPPTVRLEDLPPARPLPPARGRATRRRRTTNR